MRKINYEEGRNKWPLELRRNRRYQSYNICQSKRKQYLDVWGFLWSWSRRRYEKLMPDWRSCDFAQHRKSWHKSRFFSSLLFILVSTHEKLLLSLRTASLKKRDSVKKTKKRKLKLLHDLDFMVVLCNFYELLKYLFICACLILLNIPSLRNHPFSNCFDLYMWLNWKCKSWSSNLSFPILHDFL